ncbi:hypothetical protein [Cardinium endosymbiont of Tipula unca]|uniref:hypothetical protein n=1 Tax=Cardinium endosymbiont of Tipula unca TaxID=3066216 RepID=UPI0030D5DC13
MLIFSIRLFVKIVVLATCTKAYFLSQKVYCFKFCCGLILFEPGKWMIFYSLKSHRGRLSTAASSWNLCMFSFHLTEQDIEIL